MQKPKMSFPKCLIGNPAFLLSLFLIGCGGIPSSKSANTVAIVVFENATEEPLLERQVFATFKELFIRRGFLVVSDSRKADVMLSGKISKFDQVFLSLNSDGQASESRVAIGIEYRVSGKGLAEQLATRNVTASADYFNSADPSQDTTAKDRAIREASFRLAEKVADEIAENKHNRLPPLLDNGKEGAQ